MATQASKGVFLSYASEDSAAAARIATTLTAAGIDVWFDRSELRGGDAWDASIRRQIKNCALFIPLISKNTHNRGEGYFRLEWKLAVDRSHLMASDLPFLLPVVVDDTPDGEDRVPDQFREVQWTRLPEGQATIAFVQLVERLLAGSRAQPIDPIVRADTGTSDQLHPAGAMPTRVSAPAPFAWMFSGWRWAVATALLLAIGGTWFFHSGGRSPTSPLPYSGQDRRMTFALVPLEAPPDDAVATKIAAATSDMAFKSLDENDLWVHVAPQVSVARALARMPAPKDLAKTLNVHFLVRGHVERVANGYAVVLATVDGDSERVLGQMEVPIPQGQLTPGSRDTIDGVLGTLIFSGLQSEVERARNKPDTALDVRDLTFRAFVDWGREREANNDKGAYSAANVLLKRALALAPDDPLALVLTVQVNLCDCVEAWSTDPAEQQAIAERAVDRYLGTHANDPGMLQRRALIYFLRGRYAESLVILDSVLSKHPERDTAREIKGRALLKLGQPAEAAVAVGLLYEHHPDDQQDVAALVAAIDYELKDYGNAERLAQKAVAMQSEAERGNPRSGAVRLTLAASAARLRHLTVAKAALTDLSRAVPSLTTVSAIRKWMHPYADLYGYEPLFDGLRLAGLPD